MFEDVSQEEILRTQGTRLQKEAPWQTYNKSFEEKLDPKLEDEIKAYSERRHAKSSSQNEEELARQRELSNEMAKQYQWLTPDEYADEGPRIGKIMHSSEFITKLRNECHVQCWYREHPQPRKITLLVKVNDLPPEVGCWVQHGFMPEYSIMRFDDHGVPLDERMRGWRTCLLQLILKGVLTEETAHRVFGNAHGPVSERYLQTLYGFRNELVKVRDKIEVRGTTTLNKSEEQPSKSN